MTSATFAVFVEQVVCYVSSENYYEAFALNTLVLKTIWSAFPAENIGNDSFSPVDHKLVLSCLPQDYHIHFFYLNMAILLVMVMFICVLTIPITFYIIKNTFQDINNRLISTNRI